MSTTAVLGMAFAFAFGIPDRHPDPELALAQRKGQSRGSLRLSASCILGPTSALFRRKSLEKQALVWFDTWLSWRRY